MLHTLRVEWLKMRRYRTFWILLLMAILSIPGLTWSIYGLLKNNFPKVKGAKALLGSPFAFPDAWQTIAWNSTWLFILPAILIITMTTNEFTYRTHRQNIIDGWSRGQFISVKLFELVLLSVLCTLAVLGTTLVFGCLVNPVPAGVSIWQGSRFLFFYFVQMISYSTIAFLMALLIKRAGLSIAVFLIYLLVENIVVGIFRDFYKINGFDYMPKEVTKTLIPQPFIRKLLQSPAEVTSWEHHLPVYLTVAVVYLIIYCVIAGRRFTTSDL